MKKEKIYNPSKDILENSNVTETEFEKLYEHSINDPDSLIWWSNAFHTVNAHYLQGLKGVTESYKTWIKQIKKRNPNIWILGKDFLDVPIEGGQVKDYVIKS